MCRKTYSKVLLVLASASVWKAESWVLSPLRDSTTLEQSSGTRSDLCEELYFENLIDHFAENEGQAEGSSSFSTFRQRYILCNPFNWQAGDPVFYYVGNEANVDLYVNNTGLMWQGGEDLHALLVFGEHRYFGKSQMPFPIKDKDGRLISRRLKFLSVDQALADHARLLSSLKDNLFGLSPCIGFGGSYGGMLGYWLSLKYPALLDGLVAASAPVFEFLGHTPPYDRGSFAYQVTHDATFPVGSAPSQQCPRSIRRSWKALFNLSRTEGGLSVLSSAFKLCKPLAADDAALKLAQWASSAFDYLAMGSYPYPSDYMLNGRGELPRFPMNVACTKCAEALAGRKGLLACLRDAVGVFFNATHDRSCFDVAVEANKETSEVSNLWDYISCTDLVQPLERDGKRDMFWAQPFNLSTYVYNCKRRWGVIPRPFYVKRTFGGWKTLRTAAKNIIFTNGELDPWIGGGVTQVPKNNRELHAFVIPNAGHHIDLMWSSPLDTSAVRMTRVKELAIIRRWIAKSNGARLMVD